MVIDYYPELEEIRGALEVTVGGFPYSSCVIAAHVVQETLGLRLVIGMYAPTGFSRFSHAWNYDGRRGLYIDLTQDQFSDDRPKICILPDSTDILQEGGALSSLFSAPVIDDVIARLSFVRQTRAI